MAEMVTSGVYAITNAINGKAYIGSTIDFEGRWKDHRRNLCKDNHGNPHLQSSWNKYGKKAFEFGVLEYLDNLEELAKAEQFWMDIYREECKELYNIALTTGCPMLGRKHSKESKLKMSISRTGMIYSEEARRINSEAHKGMIPSDACRRAVSEANRRRVFSEEDRRKISEARKGSNNPNYGKPVSPENRRKIGDANRGRIHTEEEKRKMSKALKGKPHSKEHKRKNSEAQKARWAKSKALGLKRGSLQEEDDRTKVRI